MKANISLALATKIDMILSENYGSNLRKFLSFVPPTKQMSFGFDELVLTTNEEDGAGVKEVDRNNVNFAYMSNLIPEDKVMFQDKSGILLWDQFEKIITNSITANMKLSEDDQVKLKAAKKFLDNNYAKYHQYKKIYDQAKMNFVNAKISLDCSTGEEKERLQQEWDGHQKELLEDAIQSALNDLKVLGKETEIKERLQTASNIETKKGIGNLKSEIATELDLFKKTGLSEIEYFPTFYSPNNIFKKKSEWSKIKLFSSEIISLCKNAKPELKKSYPENDSGENIEYLSFEYTVASIVRPWFFEEYLNSSSFRLNGIMKGPINDGKIPANGMIPCYINKFICIKKIEYKIKKDMTNPKSLTLPIISAIPLKQFKIKTIEKADRSQLFKSILLKRTANLKFESLSAPDKSAPKVRDHRRSVLSVKDKRPRKETMINNRKLHLWNKKHIAAVANLKMAHTVKVKSIAEKPDNNLEEDDLDGIRIVAFECKRLNLSPNPDLNLNWS